MEKFIEIGNNTKIHQSVLLRNFIFIGDNVEIGEGTRISNFCSIGSGAKIGKNCNFQDHCTINSNTIIGDNCFFAGYANVADEKYPAVGKQIRKPVVFGNNVVVGNGALIIACKVGDNAVIGAHSIVFEDVPSGEVWVGNPAKPLKLNFNNEILPRTMTRNDYDIKKILWEEPIITQK